MTGERGILLTDEQLTMIIHALGTNIRINKESIDSMYVICGVTQETNEIAHNVNNGITKLKELMEYLHFSKTIYND